MWVKRITRTTDLSPDRVWAAVAAVHAGERTVEGHEAYRLEGDWAVGAVVRAVNDGQVGPDMTIVELTAPSEYAHEIALRGLVFRFGYEVSDADGVTTVVKSLTITGPVADLRAPTIGQEITSSFGAQVEALLAAA